ncbi:MAG: glycosyltransferase family 1 protein [Alistipes sp.]|nr:glycosyltransferase family 1 protein [Alistipes sp.]
MNHYKDIISHVVIDPRCKVNYASYYLYGLRELLGGGKVKFALLDYPIAGNEDYRKGFGMLVKYNDGKEVKVFVDTNDPRSIYESFYDWADVYAKINVLEEDLNIPKIFAIGPSFGVSVWNPIRSLFMGVINYIKVLKSGDEYRIPFATYIKDYIYTFWRRLRYEKYRGGEFPESRNYVFAMSTLWYDDVSLRTVNRYRGEFIRVCQKLFPVFEGGLFYIPNVESIYPPYVRYKAEFKDVLMNRRVGMQEYLRGTQRSSIVFNTPSVCQCHGWKLAEYLSMGKVIISTPLSNAMPGEFRSGVHYLCCDSVEDMEHIIRDLQADDAKRRALKKSASEYFEAYLSPQAVTKRILERAYLCRSCFD